MELLGEIGTEFWPKFWAGLGSAIIIALLTRGWLWLKQRPPIHKPINLWMPKSGIDPRLIVGEVFHQLRNLDRNLERLSFERTVDEGERCVWAISSFLYILAMLSFLTLPMQFAWLNFLLVSLLISILLALSRPKWAVVALALFPVFPLLSVIIRSRGRIDVRRAELVGKCRWHLLFAIPSTTSVRAILRRKDEHLAHVECMYKILTPLRADKEVSGEVLDILGVLEVAAAHIRSWPTECTVFDALRVPELSQVTEVEVDPGTAEE